MNWNIKTYETARGENPVDSFVDSLEVSTRAKVDKAIYLLENLGFSLGMPHSRKLTADLYELRIRGRQEVRIMYGFIGRDIYLLHGFIKKSEKTPRQEIDLATKRFSSLTLYSI